MLLVYSQKITNRLKYISEHIFSDILGITVSLTSEKDTFTSFEGPKINYSYRQFDKEIFFYATPLLFERGIKTQKIKVDIYEETPIFYISKNNSDLPFDPFAASFFLLSRYEEYLPHERDHFDRFPAEQSVAHQNNFLQIAVVDRWIMFLEKVLLKHYPDLIIKRRPYRFVPTYDIDMAYAYKNRGLFRTVGGYLYHLRHRKMDELKRRTLVLLNRKVDPFYTFDWLVALQKKYGLQTIYFFLVGEYGPYDKNISLDNLSFQSLIQSTNDHAQVGIHPSFASNKNTQILTREISNLSEVLKKDIERSRQHFIKLKIPETYQNLIELDVRKDFSMGYASQLGFRAGTASSFYFYDLNLEIKTNLKIYPFMAMDVTLREYLKLDILQSMEQLRKIMDEVKAVKGVFITLWHNHTLVDIHGWEGWKEMYEEMIKEAILVE